MGEIKGDDIAGYRIVVEGVSNEIVCHDCITQDELAELTADDIITTSEAEGEDMYFCDRCSKRL